MYTLTLARVFVCSLKVAVSESRRLPSLGIVELGSGPRYSIAYCRSLPCVSSQGVIRTRNFEPFVGRDWEVGRAFFVGGAWAALWRDEVAVGLDVSSNGSTSISRKKLLRGLQRLDDAC
ncbi:hypothetical protein QBC46DRAFT_379722 [Diplogelasinospora grovesii]|uniref:Uncharacterized protein n=1 Tax=Diplogelasinospora grovesii TaxID=303347 RepID=A0AAN6NCY4_9PEZI|nr:hypothetical protein QBC46DRAFT_379722 [Diplogelasinospora grovesii]